MKANLIFATVLGIFSFNSLSAQDRTIVNATSSEVSDNLDLRAVASIFGDALNLEDFENKINDPKSQISNLDLNNDNQVDYLRVIESVENNVHLVVVQSVIGDEVYQDVATIEVEKDTNNNIQIQVVGDVYMYGSNYIYEPVYVTRPVIYNYFWSTNYVPYYSIWRWRHYPVYYSYWTPFPVFKYRNHIGLFINSNHHYNYVTTRRCQVAYNNYYGRRSNGYEINYPNRSFQTRNVGYTNRAELEQSRPQRNLENRTPRLETTPRNTNSPREISPRNNSNPRNNSQSEQNPTPRNVEPRNQTVSPRNNSQPAQSPTPRKVEPRKQTVSPRNNSQPAQNPTPRKVEPRNQTVSPRQSNTPRSVNPTKVEQSTPNRTRSTTRN
jgi:hypothetical protein